MAEWKCVKVTGGSENWTLGKIYRTNKRGRLLDDLGKERLAPVRYNRYGETTKFEKTVASLINE